MSLPILVLVFGLLVYLEMRLYRRFGLARVSYERGFTQDAVWEGDEVEMVERIANGKWLPLPWLRLESLLSASLRFPRQENFKVRAGEQLQNHRSLFALRPYTEVVRRHRIRCAARGCFDVQTATMTAGDLFGGAQVTCTIRLSARILVYPKPAPLPELPLPWRGWQGEYAVRRWIVDDPFLVQGVRDYRPGDPMRGIHWKATARTGSLQVHNHPYTADRRLMIVLNLEVTPEMWGTVTDPALIEWGIRCALTLVEGCLADGSLVGFASNGCSIDAPKEPIWVAPGSGGLQHTIILQELAKLQLGLAMSSADLLLQAIHAERASVPVSPAVSAYSANYAGGSPGISGAAAAGGGQTDYVVLTAHHGSKLGARIEELRQTGARVDVLKIELPVSAALKQRVESWHEYDDWDPEVNRHAAG